MSDLKAYRVYANYGDGSVIVFATSHSLAKSAAFGCDGLSEDEWVELRCRRTPEADKHAAEFGPGALDAWTEKEQRFYRAMGWSEAGLENSKCSVCFLHVFSSVPESKLNFETPEDNPHCGVCCECKASKDNQTSNEL
jgi:hypothetical protein